MDDLFLALFLLTFVALIVGLIKPTIFSRITKKDFNRKKVSLYCGGALVLFLVLFGMTSETTPEAKDVVIEKKTETAETKEVIENKDATPSDETGQAKAPEAQPKETATPQTQQAPTPAPAPAKNERAEKLEVFKADATKKWGDDYSMVKFEIDKQTQAYDWVIKYATYSDILSGAKQKWGNDYAMVKYEYEKQAEAYEWLNKQTEYPNIMSKAKQKWGKDYAMVKYEYEKQVSAYGSI
jgi:hypothetical protein